MKINFWDVNKLSLFKNQSLANYVYDIGYNSGPGTAAVSLQKVLGLNADGKIGDITLSKLNSVNQELVFNKLKEYRQSWLDRNIKGKSYKKVLDQRNDSFFFHRKYIAGALILSLVGLVIYSETQRKPQRKLKTA
jgi:lysozyme family protein